MIVRTLKSSEENEIPKMINVWLSIKDHCLPPNYFRNMEKAV